MKGKVVSEGMALEGAYIIRETDIEVEIQKTDDPEREAKRFENARMAGSARLEQLISEAQGRQDGEIADILAFQLLMLEDTDYIGKIEDMILQGRWNSEYAVTQVSKTYQEYLKSMKDNTYLQERAADVADLAKQLINELLGIENEYCEPEEPYIAVAQDLTPSRVASMDDKKLKGIVLEKGSLMSHAAIIAKSRGIPMLINAEEATKKIPDGTEILLDGYKGKISIAPGKDEIREYQNHVLHEAEDKKHLEIYKTRQTKTKDGFAPKIFANITSSKETEQLVEQGGEGVGLFRTEALYMIENDTPPCETMQFETYKTAAQNLKGRPLIIRTLDVGGDKKIPYLKIPPEENPFLGYRAIRYCLENPELFKTQLSAILRASAYGAVSIMFPMIATLEEITHAKEYLEEVKEELCARKIEFNPKTPVGMMVETPMAAIDAPRFAKAVDFMSIGSNDLAQYLFAADRTNDKVSHLNSYFQPGLLRSINKVVQSAHTAGIEVDICGQAGEVLELIPIWIGMGVDNLSVSIPMITKVRRKICALSKADCEKTLSKVLDLDTKSQVRELLMARGL